MNPIIISTGIGIATQIITSIGFSALFSTVSSITSTSQNVYKMLQAMTDPDKEISKEIMQLDFDATIKVLTELINKIDINEKDTALAESVLLLRDIMFKIEGELNRFQRIMEYNDGIWLMKRFRKYDCIDSLNKLKTYKKVLDNRMKLIKEISKIERHISHK